jgi:hypothetical protein
LILILVFGGVPFAAASDYYFETAAPPIEPKSAGSFGQNLQRTIVGEFEWVPSPWQVRDTSASFNGTVVSVGSISFYGNIYAPVELPNGSEIHQVCFIVNDYSEYVRFSSLTFGRIEAAYDDETRIYTEPLGSTSTTPEEAPGWTQRCVTFPDPVLVSNWGDLNDDGFDHHIKYYLHVFGRKTGDPSGGSPRVAIQGAVLTWRRTVSPAPVAASFSDVSVDHWAFQYVEALVESGITAGCGGGKYCPDNPVTRAQMAVFLSSSLGLHWAN